MSDFIDTYRSGTAIGPFVLEEKRGQGGMGVVYSARDRRDDRSVAIKVLPATSLEDPHYARRFASEAAALAALEHPAIVRYIAHGETALGEPFLAMEWLDGEDLSQRLKRGVLSVRESAALGRRVAEALAVAHARGIIHRDIKPSNLFLRGGDVADVVILDFGVARLEDASRTLTAVGALLGTPGYMAPEQARGDAQIDARADVFALGSVLFECLTGQQAFTGQHVMAILAKVLLEEPPRLGKLRPDVPWGLDDLVHRMLAKKPAERPETADAVAAELGTMSFDDAGPGGLPASSGGASSSSLTGSEQRFLCIVAVDSPNPAASRWLAETLPSERAESMLHTLREAGAPYGAEVVRLRDGSMIATLRRAGSAADQAVHAARFALALRQLLPGITLSIATGLGDTSAHVPVGHVLDRAVSLMRTIERGGNTSVLVDEVTAALLSARFVVSTRPHGRELLGERGADAGVPLLLGRPSPCVGRERELRLLNDLLDECASEPVARVVLVTAPAGSGKSRVLHELLLAAERRDDGVSLWIGRGDPLSAGSAFALIASALRHALGTQEGESIEARRQKIRDRAALHVDEKERARIAVFLGELTGTPFPDDESPLLPLARANPTVMAEQTRRAFEDFVAAECAARPVLIALEDLHWGDQPSIKLVDGALSKLRDRPLLVAAMGRPEVHDLFPRLWRERGLHEVRLSGLTARAAERLARHALGSSASAETVARIVERAAGNAFYLEELIRAVAEGRGGDLPETVLAMVQARLDALSSDDRRFLRAASVFGEAFWSGGVAALLGGERATLASERLASLVEREVVVRRDASRFPGEEELSFRHGLLRDGAYAMLTEGDRALGHRLAGTWLEERGERDPIVLAEHFDRGGEHARAAAEYARAAQQALYGNDPRAVVALSERAIALGVEGDARVALLIPLGRARWSLGDLAGSGILVDEVLRLTPKGSRAYCSVLPGKVIMAIQRGDVAGIHEVMGLLAEIRPTAEICGGLLEALWGVLGFLTAVGAYDVAGRFIELAEQAARAASPLDLVAEGYAATCRVVSAMSLEGDLEQSAALYERALACFDKAGYSQVSALVRASLGGAYQFLGAYSRAEEELRSVLATGGTTRYEMWLARRYLALTLAEKGAYEEALCEANRCVSDAKEDADPGREGASRVVLAYALYRHGDFEDAAREAQAALDLPVLMFVSRSETMATLAAACLAQGRTAEALAVAREALGTEEPPPVRVGREPFVRLVYVEALLASGELEAARAALAVARDRLLATAAKIKDPGLRRGFLEDAWDSARTLCLAEEHLGPT